MTEPRKAIPLSREPSGAIYDGRMLLGFVFDAANGTIATLPDRMPIGVFKDWREARTAIHEATSQEVAG
jgi:hypothetical protein